MTALYAELSPGAFIPHRWLGFAWVCPDRYAAVYLPIPFNRIAATLRSAYLYLRHPDPSEWDRRIFAHYQRGYDEGARVSQRELDLARQEGVVEGVNMELERLSEFAKEYHR